MQLQSVSGCSPDDTISGPGKAIGIGRVFRLHGVAALMLHELECHLVQFGIRVARFVFQQDPINSPATGYISIELDLVRKTHAMVNYTSGCFISTIRTNANIHIITLLLLGIPDPRSPDLNQA